MNKELEQDIRDFIRRAQIQAKVAYEKYHHDFDRYSTELAQTRYFEKKLIKKVRRMPAEKRQLS